MKGLILAQPKSASTSLMKSIGECNNVTYAQNFYTDSDFSIKEKLCIRLLGIKPERKKIREIFPAHDYPAMSMAHSDVCDFQWITSRHKIRLDKEIHKQHFPPTPSNIEFFKETKKLVLIRDVEDTIESYLRVPNNNQFRTLLKENLEFRDCLKEELERWRDGWLECKSPNLMVIEFHDLIADQSETIEKASRFFDLNKLGNEYVLSKERFYRNKT